MATTIKEIARQAGVSYSTVSRALNDKKGVRADIRESIRRIAQEASYFPHSAAKALVKKRIGVLGIIITRAGEFAFQNPYYSQLLIGISSVASQHDYHLMLSINEKKSYIDLYYRRLVDGLLVVGNRLNDELLVDVEKKGVPAVVIPGFMDDSELDIPSVNSENYKSVYQTVNYLLDLGHRRIAFILGVMDSKYSLERFRAYQAAFRNYGLAYDPKYIVESDFSKTDGFRMMGQLLDLSDRPSCVICINDSVTPGALKQINTRRLRIPDDISVVAIGSSEILDLYQPALTTLRISVTEVGQTAAQMLINVIDSGSCTEKRVEIPSELIIRDSTRAWKD